MRSTKLAAVAAAVLVLTACGGSADDEGEAESTDAASTEAADATEEGDGDAEATATPVEQAECAEGDTTIRWIFGGVANRTAQDVAQEYSSMDNGTCIEIVEGPPQATDLLGTYLQAFEAQSADFDVLNIDVIWPGDLAEHLVDLNEYGAADVTPDHFPAIVENNTVDGKLVGIPYYTDAGLLYYRTDLLEEYGYDGPPETWEELEEMATTIQEGEQADNQDFTGFVWQGNAYEGLTCDALEWVNSFGGGEIVSPEGEITINNEAAVEAIDTAASWVGTISPTGVTGWAEEDSRAVWNAGNAAFMRNWPYAYSLSNADDSAIAGNFDAAPLPAGPDGSPSGTLGGWQLAVSNYSENTELAAEFALWLANEENQIKNAVEVSLLPTIESLYSNEEVLAANPWFERLYDVFTNAVARPSTITAPNYNETSVAFFNAVHEVLTGQDDAANALEVLELDIADITGLPIAGE